MKIMCTINVHEWEVVEQVHQYMNKVTVAQYKICKTCNKKRFLGAYEYWTNLKLNSIINQLSLN
jgi:hypothetical protein